MATAPAPAPASQPENRALLVLDRYANQIDRYNVLMPTLDITQISPMHQFQVSEIRINPDPKNGGDVYEEGNANGKLALLKNALHKIGDGGGVRWHPTLCRVEESRRDYVRYTAVGMILMPNGQWEPLAPGTKEIWREVECDEVMLSAENRINEGKLKPAGKDLWVRRQMLNLDAHRLRKCEAKAMNAVLRTAMKLKSAYVAAELAKPFLIPKINFMPDFHDPEVRRIYTVAGAKATMDLFGAGARVPDPQFTASEMEAATRAADRLSGQADYAGPTAPASRMTIEARPVTRPAPEGDDEGAGGDLPCVGPGAESSYPGTHCIQCGTIIEDLTFNRGGQEVTVSAYDVAVQTKKQFGQELCGPCSVEAHKARKAHQAEQAQGGQGV